MTDPRLAGAFLEAEVEALEPLDFLLVGPAREPLHVVEVMRGEDGALQVRVPGRPRSLPELPVPLRSALRERGFASEDPADPTRPWAKAAGDAASAVALAQRLLSEVFAQKPGGALDVAHGSHRAEHEARQKLAAVRARIESILTGMIGRSPEQDSDGDYVLAVDDVHVTVAPRAAAQGPVVVRVFAITNVEVAVTPELGIFLARLNFGLMFGRFALDTEHHSIWFDETLLGDQFSDEELRFAIRVVASTADEWDDRLKQMFGGATWQEVLTQSAEPEVPPSKPGQGGYL
jgi:hypothetical protein